MNAFINKADFPIFEAQSNLVYLDSAATSLKPRAVIQAVSDYYTRYSANVHRGLYRLSEEATEKYEAAREAVRSFIHAASVREIVFTRGTTEAVNLVAQSWGEKNLTQGDEIILSIAEHHSNLAPWQVLAKRKKCALKFLDINERGIIEPEELGKQLTRRSKLLAITHVSNALGTVVALKPFIQKAHAAGVKVFVDAAQSAPHLPLNVQHLDCDFLAFSGHKMLGPTGIGVLYAKEKLLAAMPPFLYGGDMIREVTKTRSTWNDLPWKFEAGTPPIAEAIGLAEAIRYLKTTGMDRIRAHEKSLLTLAIKTLQSIPGVRLFGPSDPEIQSSAISFTVEGVHPHDVAAILDDNEVAIRAGHHCCMPLMERLGVPATARASFSLYNTEEDIDRLSHALLKVKKLFRV